MTNDSVLGLDIGGANLKAAHPEGWAVQRPFTLWKHPERLAAELKSLRALAPKHDRIAVTMTGELCDCFPTKRAGVRHILEAVGTAAGKTPVRVWTTAGHFVTPAAARRDWLRVAAANWLATATWAGRFAPDGAALLIDIGSTTTDITPLWHGRTLPTGLTDPERLKSGELVYTGARRTPVCALLEGEVMAELFATTHDVYLLLKRRREDRRDCDTADGRPATRALAHARLARMLGGDPNMISTTETLDLARRVAERQARMIRAAAHRVAARLPRPPALVLTAGSGEFLAEAVTDKQTGWPGMRRVSLAQRLGEEVSQAACAYAVAVLAGEEGACPRGRDPNHGDKSRGSLRGSA